MNPEALQLFLAAGIQQKAIPSALLSLHGSWHRGKAVNIHFGKLCIGGGMGEAGIKSTEQANTKATSRYAQLAAGYRHAGGALHHQ